MKVALASDHAGFAFKEIVSRSLADRSDFQVVDLGAHDVRPSDYPDFADTLGTAIREHFVAK